MAIPYKASSPLFLCLILSCGDSLVNCSEFEVGGHDGWVVPKPKDDDQMYNQWASQNRFKVNDTLRKYHFLTSILILHITISFSMHSKIVMVHDTNKVYTLN